MTGINAPLPDAKQRHIYTLTDAHIKRILFYLLKCQRCGKTLAVGEEVFSKLSPTHHTRHWHIKCAEESHLI